VSRVYPWLSIFMALALALFEWAFFFQGANWEGPSGPFAPDRLGFNLAWVTLIYLSFQLLTIPSRSGRETVSLVCWMGWPPWCRSEFHLL
jgi:hypothetical protein